MEYRFLGNTGLKVSVIGFGGGDIEDENLYGELIKRAYDLGINFFDNAEAYDGGKAETRFGNVLKKLNIPREDLVLTTKIFWSGHPNPINRNGLSRKHLIEGVRASLKRMQLDYVDVLFAHRYDIHTPMEEICRSFDWIVRHGYALYWGTSEWPAGKIEEAFRICDKLRLIKPIAEQPEYNILARERFEKEYADLFKQYRYGSTIWSPLAGGVLTGKYNKEIPDDSRLKTSWAKMLVEKYLTSDKIDNTRKLTGQFDELAKQLGTTSAALSLAWTLKSRDVSTAIIGARKISQLEENVKALDIVKKITSEVDEKIEKIFNNLPDAGFDARYGQPQVPRRKIATRL